MRGGDLTREKIKKSAELLFAERGFNAVSMVVTPEEAKRMAGTS
jgi:hypothetical protein